MYCGSEFLELILPFLMYLNGPLQSFFPRMLSVSEQAPEGWAVILEEA